MSKRLDGTVTGNPGIFMRLDPDFRKRLEKERRRRRDGHLSDTFRKLAEERLDEQIALSGD